ncbi:MAG: hypothetical protein R2684_15580 [Pyrinomonadaceae bacterium]
MERESKTRSDDIHRERLLALYQRNGYMRTPNEDRLKEGPQTYKKGFEIRLMARDESELKEIRNLIIAVGLNPGKPFQKANQWCQPIYGRSAFEEFLAWL